MPPPRRDAGGTSGAVALKRDPPATGRVEAEEETQEAEEDAASGQTPPPRRNRVFKTHTDQLLAMLASVEPGVPGPPLPIPDNFDEMFLEQCRQPIEMLEDDSDEVKAIKRKVQDARLEIAQVMEEEGMTFREVIAAHQETVAHNYRIWRDADREMNTLLDAGDAEGARQYRDAMNEAFRQMGVTLQLELPEDQQQRRRR